MKVVTVRSRERTGRTRFERALMLSPEAWRAAMRPVFALPPGNRARTALLKTVMDHAFSALNRQDLELVQRLFYLPDMVLEFADDVGPDFAARYEGRDECFRIYRLWLEEWGTVRREPVGFVDRGETVVVLGREVVLGESSGLEVDRELGQVFRLRGAGVAWQIEYRSWDEALAH